MTYITEEEARCKFTKITAGNVYHCDRGYFYIKNDNIFSSVYAAYSEGGGTPNPKTYVIKSKNDIVKDILNDL